MSYNGERNAEGKMHGQGTFTSASGAVYEGELKEDAFHGQGTYTFSNGASYVGEWKKDKKHGQGTFTYANGDVYKGEYRDGKMHGQGTFNFADGNVYQGEWTEGKKHGQGTFTWPSGDVYQGEFKEGAFHGQGTYTCANGDVYEGEWKEGNQDGQGTFTWRNGDVYQGESKEDKRDGPGTFTRADGATLNVLAELHKFTNADGERVDATRENFQRALDKQRDQQPQPQREQLSNEELAENLGGRRNEWMKSGGTRDVWVQPVTFPNPEKKFNYYLLVPRDVPRCQGGPSQMNFYCLRHGADAIVTESATSDDLRDELMADAQSVGVKANTGSKNLNSIEDDRIRALFMAALGDAAPNADDAAKKRRLAIIAGERRKHQKRLEKVASLNDNQVASMRKAFNGQFAAGATGGFVTPEGMLAKAAEWGVIFQQHQIDDLMAIFDTDNDGKLSEAEFAVWWTCGWSSLHQAFRQRELTAEMDKITAANTKSLPEWSPMIHYSVDATIGDLPDDFAPKASVMVAATPSDKESYEAGLAENLKKMINPEDSDDEDENPPQVDAKKTPILLQVYAGVKEGASEEDVESCLEVFKAVLEEHSEQQDLPVAAKIRLMNHETTGKQMFHLTIYARTDKVSMEQMMDMGGEGPMGALFMFSQMMDHEAANVDGFDHLSAGIDFGMQPERVLSLGSNIPLLQLAEQLRIVMDASVTEHAIQMANFLVCKEFMEDPSQLDNKRRTRKLLQKLMPNGAVRDAQVSTSFASPQQVFDAAFATLQKVPVELAKDQYPEITDKQLEALQKECADMTRAVKATLQAKAPTDGTIKALTANPALRRFVNTPKNVPKVALVSAKGADVNAALQSLVDPSVAHLPNVPISVFCGGDQKNRYFVADVATDSQNLIAGFSATAIVGVVDTSSPDTITQGMDALHFCACYTEGAAAPLYATADSQFSFDSEKYFGVEFVSTSDLPSKIREASKAARGAGSGSDDESDDGSEEGGAELIKQILSSMGKAVGTLDDIFLSTANADVHLAFENFKINSLLPATPGELGVVRAQGKIVYQAVAQSAEVSLEVLKFDRIRDIMERWEQELSSADDGSDVSSDDSEGESKPKKPEWSEVYQRFSRKNPNQ